MKLAAAGRWERGRKLKEKKKGKHERRVFVTGMGALRGKGGGKGRQKRGKKKRRKKKAARRSERGGENEKKR